MSALRPTQNMTPLGVVTPGTLTAGTAATSGWISAAAFLNFLAVVHAGALGSSGTLDAKLEQATNNSGSGAKDIAGKAMTQMVKATDDGKIGLINLRGDELDIANGFRFFRVSVLAGTANATGGAVVYGIDPEQAPPAHASALVKSAVI